MARPPVETRRDHPDPGLRTRYYSAPYPDAWRAAKAAFADMPGLRLQAEDAPRGELSGVRTSPFLRLKDAVALHLAESETGEVEVQAEGEKPRTVQELLAALDRRLSG